MFPDLLTVNRIIQTEKRLADAELERRCAHFQAPPPSRAGGLGTAIRRVAASLGTLRSRSAAQQPS